MTSRRIWRSYGRGGRLAQYRGVLESLNLATLMKGELDYILERDPEHDGALHALALWHLNVPWVFGGRTDKVRGLFEQADSGSPRRCCITSSTASRC